MKRIAMAGLLAGLLAGGWASPASGQEAKQEVLALVNGLFDAMREADSATVRSAFHPELAKMASSGSRAGTPGVGFGDLESFVEAVGSVEPGAFDERIGEADIRIDDNLATVFTPYTFHHNGNLSHCGVNVFLVARDGETWKIVGLADTRRREGCEEWLK